MPVDWRFADELIDLHSKGHVLREDARRQEVTAREVLNDLAQRPGVILADEVGMGKTYVALAVAASILQATRGRQGPVVVMVPPNLRNKWSREWEQFKAVCTRDGQAGAFNWIRAATVQSATGFFREIDGRGQAPSHLVFMPSTAFTQALSDPWVRLVMIRIARSRTRLDVDMKGRLQRWLSRLVGLHSRIGSDPVLVEDLLGLPPDEWHGYLLERGVLGEDDQDPVPEQLLRVQDQLDWGRLVSVLRGEALPSRYGRRSQARIREGKDAINDACREIYDQWMEIAPWKASLLILDEAHHTKNDQTRLAGLFRSNETKDLLEASQEWQLSGVAPRKRPWLWERFDRMLFLTATPFQLGHSELIRILRSFAACSWKGPSAPSRPRDTFRVALEDLERRLNENRAAARALDRAWGRLGPAAIAIGDDASPADAIARWWERASTAPGNAVEKEIVRAVRACLETKRAAEQGSADEWSGLRTWVIRHNRPTHLPPKDTLPPAPRRNRLLGAAIADVTGNNHGRGLPITRESAIAFLLAARAQGELAASEARTRAYFAEGLCSSFEAFHHTRKERDKAFEQDDELVSGAPALPLANSDGGLLTPISWYEERIARLIPSRDLNREALALHPKIAPVVECVNRLWRSGEKVLVFCFYRETARALDDHLHQTIDDAVTELVASNLGLDSRDREQVWNRIESIARRLRDPESPLFKALSDRIAEPLAGDRPKRVLGSRRQELLRTLVAYLRTPSFIARYLPLHLDAVRQAIDPSESRPEVFRAGAEAMAEALDTRLDASGVSIMNRVERFVKFACELEERRQAAGRADRSGFGDPLGEYLGAIGVNLADSGDDDKPLFDHSTTGYRAMEVVRSVSGGTKRDTRDRVMLAFNSPLFPEILVSTQVLGEGVDLHRFCRHVIHHDLCWNPSTLEQRTGRVDRIFCKAEVTGKSIQVFEPYIAGSADERMYRVVRDRERWFQIVMGQQFSFDEAEAEEIAERVPLPDRLAQELVFDLSRARPDTNL